MEVQLEVVLWLGPTSPSLRAEEALRSTTTLLARTSWTTTRTLQRSITFIYYTLDSFIRLYTQASIYIATKLLPRDLSLDDPDVPGTRDTFAQARAATLPPSHLGACTG